MPDAIAISVELKQKLIAARTPTWKKILWWILGGFFIVLGVIGVLYLIRRKGSVVGIEEAINITKNEIAKSDVEAKIKVAKAEHAEQVVIDKLRTIKEIDNEKQRLEELNKLL